MYDQEADYSPRLNAWFSPTIDYVGWGEAVFTQPAAAIQGQTHVHYDDSGRHEIQMTVEKIISDAAEIDDVSSRLPYLFAGIESGVRSRQFGHIPQAIRNPCARLTITTPEGRFIAAELETNYHPAGYISIGQTDVVFEPLQGHFDSNVSSSAKYFVAPLTNFRNNSGWLPKYDPVIAQHPMRIFASPAIPDDLPPNEQQRAYWQQAFGQSVVGFSFLDEPAFIEPLRDHKEREQQLEEAKSKCLITAIMVGSVAQKQVTPSNWEELGFRDLLPLLSLATGTYVSSPWVELRDENGRLVQRIHTNLVTGTYKRGISALGPSVDRGGLGDLLSQAQKSTDFGKPYLRAAISQIVMGGYVDFDGNIEDRMSHLFRALDCLCGAHISRKRPAVLKPKSRRTLKRITKYFTKAIEGLAASLLTPTADDETKQEAEELTRIAEEMRGVKSSPLGFPKRIELLLEKYKLYDAQILAERYELHPGPENAKTWADVVVYYRNKVMHSAWFDWRSKRLNYKELTAITFHLHDILVRLVLILLGYNGKYVPSIFPLRGSSREIEWVQKSTTSVTDLGYER